MTKAERIVQKMLEAGDVPEKVCPLCDKEKGITRPPVTELGSSGPSHGYCPRHMKEVFGKRMSAQSINTAASKSEL